MLEELLKERDKTAQRVREQEKSRNSVVVVVVGR